MTREAVTRPPAPALTAEEARKVAEFEAAETPVEVEVVRLRAQVRAVEALAAEWERTSIDGNFWDTATERWSAERLRAALDGAR